jgi:multisubunit Na+/H+ antiporter MnhC subunit
VIDEALFQYELYAVFILVGVGLYCLFTKENLIKMVIGVEILAKGASLCFISAGYYQGDLATAQALVVTAILIEVVVAALMLSLIVNAFAHTGSVSVRELRRLRW